MDLAQVVAQVGGQADRDGKALLALHHLGDLTGAEQRLNDFLDVGDVEPVARGLGAVDLDFEVGRAADALELGLGRTGDGSQDRVGLMAQPFEHGKVGAEDLEGQVAARAGDGLVHAHFHGLGELVGDAGDFVERVGQPVGELLLGVEVAAPGRGGIEVDVGVGFVHAHGFRGEVGPAHLGDDRGDLRERADGFVDLVLDLDRLGERDTGQLLGGDDE